MSYEYKPTYVDNIDNSISIMESTDTISFCKSDSKINTLSAKNIVHKKTGEDLNLCAYDGSNFNPVITINNNHNDCKIMTNLNISGNLNIIRNLNISRNLNINSSGHINLPVGTTANRPSNPNSGTIRYNNEVHNFEGYANGTWINLLAPFYYPFSSHTFTSAGVTGRIGPTLAQMISAYSGTTWVNNTEFFNTLIDGYQLWTVPITGNYRIKAYGAPGAKRAWDPPNNKRGWIRQFGKGAMTQGDFYLKAGTKLVIIVGQRGSPNTTYSSWAASGGGASWVLSENPNSWSGSPGEQNLYCVAGGGGGEVDPNQNAYKGYVSVENAGIVQNSIITNWSNYAAGNGSYNAGGGGSYGIDAYIDSYNTGGRSPYGSLAAKGGVDHSTYPNGGEGGFGGGGATGAHASGGGAGYVGGKAGS